METPTLTTTTSSQTTYHPARAIVSEPPAIATINAATHCRGYGCGAVIAMMMMLVLVVKVMLTVVTMLMIEMLTKTNVNMAKHKLVGLQF